MSFKSYLFGSLSIATVVLGLPSIAAAESIATVRADNGVVYQIDLDDRLETTEDGWRFVSFWLSTTADSKKYRSIASCNPYQVKSDAYELDWLPNGGGYPRGTLAGEIARLACS
ncbi:hypothetical protein [Chamaesiphon sp. VAR_69_metabat_338]|uniref:hypothetical protein n=1 Tax=Chamaesiphon sp. VAR_69_metabat_338 TaxID=2964704 RepID=UPI00286E5948|nr:hypothetical protein [Chamaesiphon sp. VAR_69_metabat_338]